MITAPAGAPQRRGALAGAAVILSFLAAACSGGGQNAELAAARNPDPPPATAEPVAEVEAPTTTEPAVEVETTVEESQFDFTIKSETFDEAFEHADPDDAPVSVRIEKLDVDAEIVPVGVDDQRAMVVPGAELVGWYELGPRPGEVGSAVLAAHVNYNREPGAFFELHQLKPEDLVTVTTAGGEELSYRIRFGARLDKDELPVEDIFTNEGPAVLTLITCGGYFDQAAGHYEDNVVMVADLVDERGDMEQIS